ncbi:uncharacterized protein LOC62_07G009354 [Vanrija pseudolonga]|uniref:Uncharacterized protein n=1 Tax=Vanrija pseudolonga TaxID=143232 RepID=A0AAF0YJM5_9TREE|nr:hypothetical protein LOC62_07G009354 [Vanrija pseudolonga]
MTLLTVIVVWLYLWGDYGGIWRLLHLDPRNILRDVMRSKLMGFFPSILWSKYLEDCQNNIFSTGVITTDRGLRLVTRVLMNRAYEYGQEDITTEAIQDKLEYLFSTLPRVHKENLPFYGVRCGLVFGALAAHESNIRDRRSRKFRLGTAAVTGASSTAANVPSINGVPVGAIIEPVATGIRGTLVESFSRRQKRLGRGVTHVEYKFLTQVMEEANDGLVASYNGSAPRDKEGNPLPAFTGQGIVKFKEAAWKAFKLVMNDETCEMGIDLPPDVLKVAPEREAAVRISPLVDDDSPPPTPPPKVSPRISTDTNPQKMGLVDVMPRRPLRTMTM